jgi:hypothetical protein
VSCTASNHAHNEDGLWTKQQHPLAPIWTGTRFLREHGGKTHKGEKVFMLLLSVGPFSSIQPADCVCVPAALGFKISWATPFCSCSLPLFLFASLPLHFIASLEHFVFSADSVALLICVSAWPRVAVVRRLPFQTPPTSPEKKFPDRKKKNT